MATYNRQATLADEQTVTDEKPVADEKALDETPTPTTSHLSNKSSIEDKPTSQSADTDTRDAERQEIEEKVPGVTTTDADPNVITWESDDDPERPLNWTQERKWGCMAIVSSITFLTPLASSMVAPGVPLIMREFHSTDQTVGSFIVSIYILGYALGPLFIAPMSEVYGRVIVYHACNVQFAIWTMACALSPNMGALLVFRLLAGIAGSCPITIGGGTIADMFAAKERGGAMALFAMGPLLGPVIGPVAGGFLSQDAGWRWVFWVILICSGVLTCAGFLLLRETYEPVLLQRKVDVLIKETGNQDLRSKLHPGITKKEYFKRSIIRPTKMLLFSPIVLIFSIYMAIIYGYLYLLFTTLTLVFEGKYGFSQGSVGLTFLGIGVGSLIGLFLFGGSSDRIIKAMEKKKGVMKPEYRLVPLTPGSTLIPIGLFIYGWTAQKGVHWIAPIIGTGFVGMGLIAIFMCVQTYMVDVFTIYAASAIAANTVLRSLMGAFLPLAGPSMYKALGLGWGNSLLGFIAAAMVPVTWFFYKYGEKIRTHPRFQVKF